MAFFLMFVLMFAVTDESNAVSCYECLNARGYVDSCGPDPFNATAAQVEGTTCSGQGVACIILWGTVSVTSVVARTCVSSADVTNSSQCNDATVVSIVTPFIGKVGEFTGSSVAVSGVNTWNCGQDCCTSIVSLNATGIICYSDYCNGNVAAPQPYPPQTTPGRGIQTPTTIQRKSAYNAASNDSRATTMLMMTTIMMMIMTTTTWLTGL